MITLEQARGFVVDDPNISDERLQEAIDACRSLARLVVERALQDKSFRKKTI
jgi:hypothetical protein